jgi:hypothetical protein
MSPLMKASRVRRGHALENLGVLRRLSVNLLKHEPSKLSLKMKRYKAGWTTISCCESWRLAALSKGLKQHSMDSAVNVDSRFASQGAGNYM